MKKRISKMMKMNGKDIAHEQPIDEWSLWSFLVRLILSPPHQPHSVGCRTAGTGGRLLGNYFPPNIACIFCRIAVGL